MSGSGNIQTSVSSSGTVAPSGTLRANALTLNTGGSLAYSLGGGTNSLLAISSSLTLSLSITVNVSPGASWGNNTYVLATYGSLTDNSSSFSGWTVGVNPLLGRHTYTFSVSGVSSGSLDLTVGSAATVSGTWSGSGGGSWGTAGDWQGSNIPGYVGDTATFGTGIGSTAATVTLDGARGLSGLTLSTTGGGSYTLSRSGGDTASTLILANGGSPVPLSVTSGSQTIAVPVTLYDKFNLSTGTGARLTISGNMTGAAAVAVSGSGRLVLSGTNTYTGGTTVTGGTLDFANPNATPSTGIVTATTGGYVALGALSGASSPATDATETVTDTSETLGTVATSLTAIAGGAVAGGGGDSLGGTGSIAEAVPAAAVPEPSTFVLLGVAAIGLIGYVWRRRKRISA